MCISYRSRLYRLMSHSNHVGCEEDNPDSEVVSSQHRSSQPNLKFISEIDHSKPNDDSEFLYSTAIGMYNPYTLYLW